MKKLFYFLSVIIGLAVFASCYKDDPAYDVSITFIEPENGAVMVSGDSLHMEIDFECTKVLNNIEVLAINTTSGDTIANFTETTTDRFFNFHEHIMPVVTVSSNINIIASGWESDYANRISKQVSVTINP